MNAEYWIGIDIGTTNTKAVAFTSTGEVTGHHSLGYDMVHPEHEYSEQEADVIWRAAETCLKEVITQLGTARIRAISFSAAMHSIMAVDMEGTPLSNLVIWADNRAVAEANELQDRPEGKQIFERCGTPLHAMTPLCKLMWWQKNDPELCKKAFKFVGVKEYIWYKLTGEWAIDYSLASATAMFDLYYRTWNTLALQTAGVTAEQLSTPVSTYHTVNADLSVLGVSVNTEDGDGTVRLLIGASDGCLANLGTGAIIPGRLAVTIGTSGAVRVCSDKPILDPAMRIFCYLLDEDTYIVGGGTNSGGVVFRWLTDELFKSQSEEELTQLAEEIPAGADGLLFLPYLLGERSPIWNSAAKGAFYGLTIQHTASHLVRAVLEGITLHTYSVVEILSEMNSITEIYASGGMAKSNMWVQMLADVCGKPIYLPETVEAGAWGAVLMAMKEQKEIKHWTDSTRTLAISHTYEPNLEKTRQYQEIFTRFMRLYQATKDI